MRRKADLTLGEWAVLALLCERPAHGYAVRAALAPDGEVGRIWAVREALTYRILKHLQTMELVEVAAVVESEQAPPRTELQATEQGRELVSRWLHTPEQHVRDLRSSLLLKITMLRRSGSSPARLLEEQDDILQAQEESLATETTPDDIVGQWRLTITRAARQFVQEALERERIRR